MKYLSFVIPCYNSSAYMKKCINSILALGDDVEILIVDDGSNKDDTLEIAKSYEKIFPNICKAIHKENGGHGDALNVGIKNATGLFLKVVDSDDFIDVKAGNKLLDAIKKEEKNKTGVDMFVTNFIYDKVGQKNKKVMSYKSMFPQNKAITWDKVIAFLPGHYLLMHSITYRTSVLKASNLNLPKKTFYVDNIYAYKPLVNVKKVYYLNVNLYHYYIGRDDQSVNEKVMIGRLEQQYRVTRIMLYEVDLDKVKNKKLKEYMITYMGIIITITSVLSIISKDEKWFIEKENLWEELKKKNSKLYFKLRYSFLGVLCNFNSKIGNKFTTVGYKIMNKIYGFN